MCVGLHQVVRASGYPARLVRAISKVVLGVVSLRAISRRRPVAAEAIDARRVRLFSRPDGPDSRRPHYLVEANAHLARSCEDVGDAGIPNGSRRTGW